MVEEISEDIEIPPLLYIHLLMLLTVHSLRTNLMNYSTVGAVGNTILLPSPPSGPFAQVYVFDWCGSEESSVLFFFWLGRWIRCMALLSQQI